MIERAHGLILRVRPFTESSLIVHWLTLEFGRLNTVAKGARRPKSPFRGKLDLFYEADLSFIRSRRSDLHTLGEVARLEVRTPLRQDLERLQQASYAASLVEQATEPDTPVPAVFALMKNYLDTLCLVPSQPLIPLAFELKLLAELGLNPAREMGGLPPGTKQITARCIALDWTALGRLKPSATQLREISRFLYGFLVYHLGRVPHGRSAVRRDVAEREFN